MEYKYKAKKSLNEVIEGVIQADTLEQAVAQLGKQGIVPIVVTPASGVQAEAKRATYTKQKAGSWSLKKVTLFTRKLYNLSKSNVELLSALRLIQQETKDPTERIILDDMIKNIKEGLPLSECLNRWSRYFPPIYINTIRIGENSGQLKDSFTQLLSYLERLEGLRMKVWQALAYPIFMIVVGIGTIFTMLTFILPRLITMFEDFQATLPLPTRVLLATSTFFKKYWLVMIVVSLIGFFILEKVFGGRQNLFSFLKYRLPFIKNLVYKQSVASFSTSLSLLLKSGVNLLSALGIASAVIGNPKYIAQLEVVRQDIKEGSSFSQALAKFKIFPDFFLQMIRVGEEGGRLDSVLADIADSYEQEIESDLKIVSSLIEPAIILVLGLIIGAMVIAVLLPIFNINAIVS